MVCASGRAHGQARRHGGAGDHLLHGGNGNDLFVFADVQAPLTQVSADTLLGLGNGSRITLMGVTAVTPAAADFQV